MTIKVTKCPARYADGYALLRALPQAKIDYKQNKIAREIADLFRSETKRDCPRGTL